MNDFISPGVGLMLCVSYLLILSFVCANTVFQFMEEELVSAIATIFCSFVICLVSFLFGYNSGDLRDALAALGKNKSKFKKSGVRRVVYTEDYDPIYNRRLIEKGGGALRRLRGKSIVEYDGTEYFWPFPIFAVQEVNIWLQTATKKDVKFASVDQSVIRRAVRAFGASCVAFDMKRCYVPIFVDEVNKVAYLAANLGLFFLLEGNPFRALMSTIAFMIVCVCNARLFMMLPLGAAVPLAALVEEIHKEWFWAFGPLEYAYKIGLGVASREAVMPLAFHTASLFLPLQWRVLAHVCYNFTIMLLSMRGLFSADVRWYRRVVTMLTLRTSELGSMTGASLTQFSLGDKVIWAQLLQVTKMAADGLTSHILGCFFTFGWYDQLLSYLEKSMLSIDFLLALVSPGIPILTSGGSRIGSIMSKILPEFISKSPSFTALVTFSSCLVGCFLFGSHHEFLEFLPMVDFSHLSVKEAALTAVEASWTIAKSLYKVYESGNLWDFFQRPKSFALRMKIVELTGRKAESELEQELLVKDIDELMEKLAYETDPFFVNQMVALTKKKDEYSDKILTTKAIQDAAKFLGRAKDTLLELETGIVESRELASNPLLRAAPNMVTLLTSHEAKLRRSIRRVKERTPPFVIILLGSPGTGKTTVIKQLVNAYFTAIGEKFDIAMKAELSMDDKYPAEGTTGNERVLVMNDLVGDHSQDTKSDRTSLGVYLQQIMDTVNLRFKSAGLDGKELVFTPDLVFITTNDRSWVFSERTERLQRRFNEFAIIVELEVVEGGCKVPVDTFETWSTERRNQALSAKLVRANCSEKFVTFTTHVTEHWCHVSEFYRYVVGRFLFKPRRENEKAELLKNTCPCGFLYHSHFVNGQFVKYYDVCVPVREDDLIKIPSPCLCGLEAGHEPFPLWDHSKDAHLASMLRSARPHVSSTLSGVTSIRSQGQKRSVSPEEMPILTFGQADVSTLIVYSALFWIFFDRLVYVGRLLIGEARRAAYDVSMDVEYRAQGLIVELGNNFSPERVARATARRSYLRTVKFLRENALYLAGGAGLVALWSYLTQPALTGKVITAENIDHNSLRIKSFTQEVNYPREVREEWGVPEKKVNLVKLNKVGVSDQNLELALSAQSLPFLIEFGGSEGAKKGFALMLNSSWCWTSKHYFFDANGNFLTKNVFTMKGIKTNIGRCDVVVVHSDAVIFRSPVVLPVKDLLDFFVEDLAVSQIEARVYGSVDSVTRNTVVGPPPYQIAPQFLNEATTVWLMPKQKDEHAPMGECGLPLIVKSTKGWAIAGMVNFRWGGSLSALYQGGVVVTRSQLVRAMESHSEPHLTCMILPNVGAEKALDVHSEFRSLSTPFVDVIGSVGGACSKFKSDFRVTHLHQFIVDKGLLSKPYAIPTRINRVVGEGPDRKYVSAFRQTMAGIEPNGLFFSDAVDRSVSKYVEYVLEGVQKEYPDLLCSPLSLAEAFLGKWEQDVVRCNFKSSVGPEDRVYKDRNGIFSESLGSDGSVIYSADPAFVTKVQQRLDLLTQGCAMCPWVCGAYKDEIRAAEKLENCEIRLFYTVDLYTNTLARMYLLPLVQVLMKYPKISKCFGKLNSGSSEWDDLFKYLKGDGRRLMDLDFKKFDISHAYRIIRAVALVFHRLALAWYKDEESARVCYGLVFALCCQLFEHKTDFAVKHKGLPSGHIVTLILNCLVNILLMLIAFEKLCPDCDFFENVFPATVGDDNISGVEDRVASRFNLVTLQPIYETFGYSVTDASKSAVTQPFVEDDKAQFLKRRFRYEKDVKGYVAPLERDSVFKMLAFWCARNDGGTSYTQRMADVVDVAQRELFLHGREDLEEFIDMFKPVIADLNWAVKWYSYEELKEKYLSKEQFMFWA